MGRKKTKMNRIAMVYWAMSTGPWNPLLLSMMGLRNRCAAQVATNTTNIRAATKYEFSRRFIPKNSLGFRTLEYITSASVRDCARKGI